MIYRMHEWINVSVSSRFPEKGKGDVIFRSIGQVVFGVEEFVTVKSEVGLGVGESPKVVAGNDEGGVVAKTQMGRRVGA